METIIVMIIIRAMEIGKAVLKTAINLKKNTYSNNNHNKIFNNRKNNSKYSGSSDKNNNNSNINDS